MGRKKSSIIRDIELRDKVVEILLQNLRKDISLCNLIEDNFNLSYKHINKIFKRITQLTIFEYHNRLLVKHACYLLKNYDCFYISLELGFSDESYFCNWFKKITSITPSLLKIKKHILQEYITKEII
ncbi:MAG: hypothetical protein CSA15_03250 [Candidatus Delongbacteria bacterium]|nr:MAG: hypothetical protein CSA15_03250 [Candidatus Delongbacteria bacterium]